MTASGTREDLEKRYRLLFEQAPVGVLFFNRDLYVTECNSKLLEIARSTPQDFVRDLTTVADPRIRELLVRTLAGEEVRYENAYTTRNGVSLHISVWLTPLRDSQGEVVAGLAIVEDTTERTRTQEALRKSEARFRELVERAQDMIAVFSSGRCVFANPAFARGLGYDLPSELHGRQASDLLSAGRVPVASIEPPGGPVPQENELIRKSGSPLIAMVLTLPTEYDGRAADLWLARDVTEERLLEKRLLQTDRMLSMGTLAAGVAHDLHNPLSYLAANLDHLAVRRLPDFIARLGSATVDDLPALRAEADRIATMVAVAREGSDRVRAIVRDMRTFSQSGDAQHGPVEIERVLEACINLADPELRSRARVVRRYGNVPTVHANETRLGQVFLNLIVNAVQALPTGHANEHEIILSTRREGKDHIAIEVADTGPGIPAEVVSRIFDPFFTTKPEGLGTGLGLWICQGIVKSLGGSIRVENRPVRGAAFVVTLPV